MSCRLTRWHEPEEAWGWSVFNLRGAQKLWNIAEATQRQIALAAARQPLSDYRQAADISYFWTSAPNNETAYLKAAYWLAVAARLTGSWGLVAKAQWNAYKGAGLSATPGSSLWTSGVSGIYRDAAQEIVNSVGNIPPVQPILRTLGYHSTADAIAPVQERAHLESTGGKVAETVRESLRQAKSPTELPWQFWATIGGLALVVVLVAFARGKTTYLVRGGGSIGGGRMPTAKGEVTA